MVAARERSHMTDKPEIVTKVEAIAKYMPEGWCASVNPIHGEYMSHGHYLVGPDGAKLFVRVETYGSRKGDLSISGCYESHQNVSSPSPNPSISVGGARSCDAVAKEIGRRLLSAYLPLLAKHAESIKQADAAVMRQAHLIAKLTEGLHLRGTPKDGKASVKYDGAWEYSDVDIEVARNTDEGAEVTIKFDRMTEAQALRLCQWMREHLEGAAQLR